MQATSPQGSGARKPPRAGRTVHGSSACQRCGHHAPHVLLARALALVLRWPVPMCANAQGYSPSRQG
eukprot:1418764-Alexandrium_andersonii.AAC.1